MKWYGMLTGYVEVNLWGENPERVINMAMSRGIYLWDIRQVDKGYFRLKVRLGGYKALRHIVRRSSCRIKIREKKGFPFWLFRAQKRKILVSGVLFFCLTLYLLSSFVWFIEIRGNERVPGDLILTKVEERGLKKGVPIKSFNKETVKEKLLIEIPELAWVGITIQGTKVIIEVVEKTVVPYTDESKPADLVAGMDGQVEELLVLKGTPLIKEGDMVTKGQVLIQGLVYPQIQVNQDGSITPSGNPERVRARGVVRSKVTRKLIGQCAVKEEGDLDTGAETTIVILRFMGREVIVSGPKTVPYERYRKIRLVKTLFPGRNILPPVELITDTYFQQEHYEKNWGVEGAYQEAVKRARAELLKALPQDHRIIKEGHEPVPAEKKGLIKALYFLETIEDIGVYKVSS
ncbi:MAG: putative rane protein [Peptococcaceae bacterium]|jgi:similar to stage IV sporulation protein|nr:putative rane protein [Peptococcaceae bacterium]